MTQRKTIPIQRFLDRFDSCINRNDKKGARECLVFWEKEARECGDDRGLLTVLNEAVGYYRRAQRKGKAFSAMEECLALAEKLELSETMTGATVLINSATTLSFFGREAEAVDLYGKAAAFYEGSGRTESYEYAALLNNRAATYNVLKDYDAAENDWKKAIEILRKIGYHDGEIAISLLMLAHLTFDRDDTAYEQCEKLIDEAWEYLNSDNQPKDGRYADVLMKCAPSFDYFQRPIEAQAARDVAHEIWDA